MSKKYTLSEIAQMRSYIIEIWEHYPTEDFTHGYPNKTSHVQRVEERLRTLMQNGTTVNELRDYKISLEITKPTTDLNVDKEEQK